MITADGVVLTSGDRHILGPVDVSLQAGRTTVLLGPNGAGKSSLVRVLSGFVRPDAGEVQFDGRNMDTFSAPARARRLGVLTQHVSLEFPFTAGEVIALGRTPYGNASTDTRVVAELVEFFEINADQVFTTMSGGERQLVQLARVLAQVRESDEPAYLMLDEPMTALDLHHQARVVSMLGRLSAAGTGQLIVMHDINLAAEVADDVVLMRGGTIVASGAPDEVMTAETISAVFGTQVELLAATPHRLFRTRSI